MLSLCKVKCDTVYYIILGSVLFCVVFSVLFTVAFDCSRNDIWTFLRKYTLVLNLLTHDPF